MPNFIIVINIERKKIKIYGVVSEVKEMLAAEATAGFHIPNTVLELHLNLLLSTFILYPGYPGRPLIVRLPI